ncbi:acyl-coenzyme A thioesterase THEM4-like isoform X2 [Hyla sarda]|nr:acyl-coenzyme A thioesterase THEM4-like isoform X2 [Hyla sarda]
MLHICSRLLGGGAVLCLRTSRSHTGPAPVRWFSVGRPSHGPQDYSLPNATWSRNTRDLYDKYEELSKTGGWRRIKSYNSSVHHMSDQPPVGDRVTRLFTRNIDQDGLGFEYCMFYNVAEKRMVCIFQPGPYLEGPPGYTHGGCIATMLDSTLGAIAVYVYGHVMTANLNINYRNPIPLGCTVLVDGHLEKLDGRKVFTRGQIRSYDDRTVHTEATGLFITLNCPDEGGSAD